MNALTAISRNEWVFVRTAPCDNAGYYAPFARVTPMGTILRASSHELAEYEICGAVDAQWRDIRRVATARRRAHGWRQRVRAPRW